MFSRRFRERQEELLKRKQQRVEKIIREENDVRIMIFNGMWHSGFYLRTEGNIDDL